MANFWQKNYENGKMFRNLDFSLENGNFWQYSMLAYIDSYLFAFNIFSIF